MSNLFLCRLNSVRSLSMLHTKAKALPPVKSTNANKNSSTSEEVAQQQNEPFNEEQLDFSLLHPDKFGDISYHYKESTSADILKKKLRSENMKDEPDGYDKLEIKRGPKKSMEAYARIWKELERKKPMDVAEILKLHQEFVYEDRYIPDKYMYTVLFSACAQVGYTKKAIELFYEMRRYELTPSKPGVTALINACANCSHTNQYGLEQVKDVREKLQLAGYEFNAIHYNCLIKAFARLGDMTTAYATLQEMTDKGHSANLETYAMLLMGCISDTKQGLFEATKIVSRLTQSNQLNLPIVNLFLRAIRDCGIGSDNLQLLCFKGTLNKPSSGSSGKGSLQTRVESQLPTPAADSSTSLSTETLPNLLTGANLDRIVSIEYSSLQYPGNRFLLYGGLKGFIQLLDAHKVVPNNKTIGLIISFLSRQDCLAEVRRLLKKYNLKADVYMYNLLLKKYSKEHDYPSCQEIIRQMQSEQIPPDIMTFGALTLGCLETKHAKRLLREMSQCNIAPNEPILGALITIACSRQDLDYVSFMLDYIRKDRLPLTKTDIEKIDLFLNNVRRDIANKERNNESAEPTLKESYQQVASKFRATIKKSTIQVNTHPWSQFESSNIVNKKEKFNSFVKIMKEKTKIKMRKERPQAPDYNDEID